MDKSSGTVGAGLFRPGRASSRLLGLVRAAGAAGLALGCAVEAVDSQAEPTGSEVHGYVRITEKLGKSSERADALGVFVRFPSGAESPEVLSALGVDVRLPEPGLCDFGAHSAAREAEVPLSSARAELLLADWVALRFERPGAKPEEQILAPHAFPTIGGTVGGALYTSRTRRAEDLPTGVRYTLSVVGLDGDKAPRDFAFRLPERAEDVTISGLGWAELDEVRLDRPLDVTWTPEAGHADLGERRMVVELGDATRRGRCVFSESEGLGTLPREILAKVGSLEGAVTVSIRKLTRGRASASEPASTLDVLFESEISKPLRALP